MKQTTRRPFSSTHSKAYWAEPLEMEMLCSLITSEPTLGGFNRRRTSLLTGWPLCGWVDRDRRTFALELDDYVHPSSL
jgi:hypothetical protein